MNILLTNDDGYNFKGIQALKSALSSIANITIVAPLKDMSACSQAITLHSKIQVQDYGDEVYSVNGYTADSVNIGLHSKINKNGFDLVISGINKGVNMGYDTFYSGTVAGARHAYIHKYNGIAISCGHLSAEEDFEPIALYLKDFLIQVYPKLKKPFLLNLNYPINNNNGQIRWTKLGERIYQDYYTNEIDSNGVENFYFQSSVLGYKNAPETDFEAYNLGYVSITPLNLDTTHYDNLKKWRSITYAKHSNHTEKANIR